MHVRGDNLWKTGAEWGTSLKKPILFQCMDIDSAHGYLLLSLAHECKTRDAFQNANTGRGVSKFYNYSSDKYVCLSKVLGLIRVPWTFCSLLKDKSVITVEVKFIVSVEAWIAGTVGKFYMIWIILCYSFNSCKMLYLSVVCNIAV